jgi:hypothetical protein
MFLPGNHFAIRAISKQDASDLAIGITCGFLGMAIMLTIVILVVRYSPGGRERINEFVQKCRRRYVGALANARSAPSSEVAGNASRPNTASRTDDPGANNIEMDNRGDGWRDVPL